MKNAEKKGRRHVNGRQKHQWALTVEKLHKHLKQVCMPKVPQKLKTLKILKNNFFLIFLEFKNTSFLFYKLRRLTVDHRRRPDEKCRLHFSTGRRRRSTSVNRRQRFSSRPPIKPQRTNGFF